MGLPGRFALFELVADDDALVRRQVLKGLEIGPDFFAVLMTGTGSSSSMSVRASSGSSLSSLLGHSNFGLMELLVNGFAAASPILRRVVESGTGAASSALGELKRRNTFLPRLKKS